MFITEGSIPTFSTDGIEIQNCERVHFQPNAIRQLRSLRHINLRNIPFLQFEESSLAWSGYAEDINYDETYMPGIPSLAVLIENCNITKLRSFTFKGHIGEIIIKNVNMDTLDTYAFTSLKQTQTILIQDSTIQNIRLEPFKKLSTATLELNNVRTDLVPSRTFSNVNVYNKFLIRNCNFRTVRPGGFLIHSPQYSEISNTRIDQLDGEGFTLITKGGVVFKNNIFVTVNDFAFASIKPNDELVNDKTITFDSNTFSVLTRDSLTITAMAPKYVNLLIKVDCDCKYIEHNLKNSEFHSEMKCQYNDQFVSVNDYKSRECSVIISYATTFIIVGVVTVLVIAILLVLILYYRKVYLSKKYGDEKMSKKGNLSLIVPDGKTYRETELHVIVERADLLTTDL